MADETPLRLASIVGVDIAGYSARTEADSSAAARQVVAMRTRIADIAARHHGRIFNTAGDGVMMEFAAATDAVEAIYELLDERPAREPEAHIGAHLGDVTTTENGDLLGHGVNVAARLMAMAPAGRAVISQDLKAAAGSYASRTMRSLGEVALAKMHSKVHAYEIAPDAGPKLGGAEGWRSPRALAAAGAVALVLAIGAGGFFLLRGAPNDAAPDARAESGVIGAAGFHPAQAADVSIAVLPFVNMSSDPEQEYFSDGLSEELMNQLANVEGLRVTARTSSFAFKGKNEDLRVIGEKLGVAHVLEGSVRKAGERLRITAQLIKVADGSHLWSETYDRNLDDVFAIQESIATTVAGELSERLGIAAARRLDYGGTKSFEAYDRYLKGLNEPWRGHFDSAIDHFRQAVAIDPNYALAWAALAAALTGAQDMLEPGERAAIEAERAAASQRALALAPNLPDALIAEAYGQALQRHWANAETLLEKTKANSSGNDPSLIEGIGWYYLVTGRYQEGQPYLERARDLDPLQLSTSNALLRGYFTTQAWEKFDAEYRRSIDLGGNRESFEFLQLARLVIAGADRQAIDAQIGRARAQVKFPGQGAMVDALAKITASPGDTPAILREERATNGDMNTRLAIFAAYYGESELALDILESVVEFAHPTVYQQFWNPQFSDIRKTARFKKMMRDVGFADFWLKTGNWPDFCRPVGRDDFECF